MIIYYVLFALSLIFPIYTYAIYPVVLKLMLEKKYEVEEYHPYVTAIVFAGKEDESNIVDASKKVSNLHKTKYKKLEVLVAKNTAELNDCVSKANGEIVLFTDNETMYEEHAISNLMVRFVDQRVGCVVGQQRKRPDKDGKTADSVFWKYENKVKALESRIGCVSGANGSIYAVRKALIPEIKPEIINKNFFVATSVTQIGKDVVFEPSAMAYEELVQGNNFEQHVCDGVGNYQALGIFWRMLLPRKGWFVYVGHRVMKWLVPFNMIVVLVMSAGLAFSSKAMLVILCVQILGYSLLVVYHFVAKSGQIVKGTVGKLLNLAYYFFSLNYAWLVGAVVICKKINERFREI